MLIASSLRSKSKNEGACDEDVTARGTSVASLQIGKEGRGVHSCLPLDGWVPTTWGLGISVLTILVTRGKHCDPPCRPASGVKKHVPKSQVSQLHLDPGTCPLTYAGVTSLPKRKCSPPGADVGVGIVVSSTQQMGKPGDM